MRSTLASIGIARWARGIRQSALHDIHPLLHRPGVINLALGLPEATLFPTEAFARAAAGILSSDPLALQYAPPLRSLKVHIVALMRERGVSCREEQVFLTSGAQQAMDLLARLLLERGGSVLIEEPTFDGIHMAIRPFEPHVLTVPSDPETGMDLDAVERILASGAQPAFIYAITDGHNPLGASLSAAKRARLVEVARRHRVPIIEDDAYGFLSYAVNPLPPLRALDDEWALYVGSFSKILAPGVRVGWAIVPEPLVSSMSILKHAADLDVATFAQRAVCAYLDSGDLGGHVDVLRREYAARRDAMAGALRRHFPSTARWSLPSAGMFMWVELPDPIDTVELLKAAVESERVAFVPGAAFCAGPPGRVARCLRLSFSNSPPDRIEEGVARLARLVARACP